MADNITAPASGTVFATDDVAGVQYPRTKLCYGPDGSATDVSLSNRLPVADSGVVEALGAILSAIGSTAYFPSTQAVSAAALPLPAGAATDASVKALAAADDLFAITPGTAPLGTIPKALLVTAAGTLSVGGTSNTSVSLGQVTVGQIIPLRARYVYAAGTTATVVGLA